MNGKKMVSSVVVCNFDSKGIVTEQIKVSYGYDRNGWLESVKVTSGKEKITIVRNDNRLESNFYDYVVNENGYIVLKELKYNIGSDVVKKRTRYFYDGSFLRQISRQQFVMDGNKWSPAHDIYYLNFTYFKGDCYWENAHSNNLNINMVREYYGCEVKYRNGKYSDIVNDTNINPNLFLSMLCWEICLDAHEFELSTEWCGMVSEHILEYEDGFRIETIINERGNISEMFTRYKNGNLFRKLSIKYAY